MKSIFAILFFVLALKTDISWCQFKNSFFSKADLKNLLENKEIEAINPFEKLFERINDSTMTAIIYHANFDIDTYDFKKSVASHLKFIKLETLWLFNGFGNNDLFASIEHTTPKEYNLSIPMPFEVEIFNTSCLSKINLQENRIFMINGLDMGFIQRKECIYVIDEAGLIEFGEFFKKRYTIEKFREIFNSPLR